MHRINRASGPCCQQLGRGLTWGSKQLGESSGEANRPARGARSPSHAPVTAPGAALDYRDPVTDGGELVIILQIGLKGLVKLAFMKHGHPVRTFSADGANQWLQARRLPRAARSDAFVADSHAFDPSAEGCAMNRIGISQVICGRGLVRKGVNDLLGDPFGSGRFRDVEVNDFTSLGREHDQHVQQPASHGGDHKEVQGGNGPRVVAQNSPPALGWPAPGLGPLLPNSSGPGVEPQCCQLIADAGTAPGRV